MSDFEVVRSTILRETIRAELERMQRAARVSPEVRGSFVRRFAAPATNSGRREAKGG